MSVEALLIDKLKQFFKDLDASLFVKNIRLFLGGRAFLAISTLLIGVITARLLTPENRGLYALFFTTSGLFVTLLHVGISPANIYFLNNRKRDIGELLGNTIVYIAYASLLLFGLFAIAVIYDFRGPFADLNPLQTWLMMWLVVLATLVEVSVSGLIYASNLYGFISRALILQSAMLLLATLAIYFTAGNLVYGLAFRVFAVCIFVIWFLKSFAAIAVKKLKFSYPILKAQLQFGSKNWVQNIISFLNVRSYILILGVIAAPEEVGFFSVAWLFVEVVRFIPDTLGTMILPTLTECHSDDERSLLALKSIKLICAATVLLTIFLLLILHKVIPFVFGAEYSPSIIVANILISGSIFGTIYQVVTRYFTSIRMQKFSIGAAFCGMVVGIATCFWLTSIHNGSGAAIAYLVGTTVTALISIYYFRKCSGCSFRDLLTFTKKDFLIS